MKLTFAQKTFAAGCFRSTTLTGPAVPAPPPLTDAQVYCLGAAAGRSCHAGATIGQDYHTGATEGLCYA